METNTDRKERNSKDWVLCFYNVFLWSICNDFADTKEPAKKTEEEENLEVVGNPKEYGSCVVKNPSWGHFIKSKLWPGQHGSVSIHEPESHS